jgi:hypothetical protein
VGTVAVVQVAVLCSDIGEVGHIRHTVATAATPSYACNTSTNRAHGTDRTTDDCPNGQVVRHSVGHGTAQADTVFALNTATTSTTV